MEESQIPESKTLLADVPIEAPEQDRLGRAPFVRSLASTVLSMKGEESFVFGLCGPWGSGKSSVLKLVARELATSASEPKPVLVNFNPWWFSGRDQLLQAFLAQLGGALGRVDTGKRTKKLGKQLALLGKILQPVALIPGAGLVKKISELFSHAGEATVRIGEALSTDVHTIRKEIDGLLRQFPARVVIFMDDIDRLTAYEIAQLFLIVKAVADFPNTVYLLAFDPEVVSRAISDKLGLDGTAYLEKIVQVQIDLPSAGPIPLQQMFLAELGTLISENLATPTSRHDFANLFHQGIKEFFCTPRAVKRLINVLRVLYPAIEGEVYWPDFVGVAALMVFAPQVHGTIRDNPEHFTGSERWQRDDRDQEKESHEEWLSKVSAGHKEGVSGIVCGLFPKAKSALKNYSLSGERESRWQADLRICSGEVFPRYFQLSVPSGAISETEWNEIINSLADSTAIDRRIGRLCQEPGPHGLASRAKEFLERASVFAKHRASEEEARALFRALLRNGDRFVDVKDTQTPYVIPIGNDLRLSWAMEAALLKVEDEASRESFLEQCMSDDVTLYTAVHFVWFLGAQHGRFGSSANEPHETHYVSEACVDRLATLMLSRIRQAGRDGTLTEHRQSMLIAREWRAFSEEKEAREWVTTAAQDDRVLVAFVEQVCSVAYSHGVGDLVARAHPRVDAKYLVTWFDGSQLRQRCEGLLENPPQWLSTERQDTLRLLVGSIQEDGTVVDVFERKRQRLMTGEGEDEDDS